MFILVDIKQPLKRLKVRTCALKTTQRCSIICRFRSYQPNEKVYCVKLTSVRMRIHYKLLPCEKLHYKTHQCLMELSAVALWCRGESREMSHVLPEASLKQGEICNVSKDGFNSIIFKRIHYHKIKDSVYCDKTICKLALSVDQLLFRHMFTMRCFLNKAFIHPKVIKLKRF